MASLALRINGDEQDTESEQPNDQTTQPTSEEADTNKENIDATTQGDDINSQSEITAEVHFDELSTYEGFESVSTEVATETNELIVFPESDRTEQMENTDNEILKPLTQLKKRLWKLSKFKRTINQKTKRKKNWVRKQNKYLPSPRGPIPEWVKQG